MILGIVPIKAWGIFGLDEIKKYMNSIEYAQHELGFLFVFTLVLIWCALIKYIFRK